jgi:hypothetical protein
MTLRLTLACWLLLSGPAHAKPNEPLNVAWSYARALGIKQGEYSIELPSRVTAETWIAPESGWSFDKAKSLANLMMNAKKPKRVHRPSPEYTVLNYPNGAVALKLVDGKIVELIGLAPDWHEDKSYINFTYRMQGDLMFVNDKVNVTMALYHRLPTGMSRFDAVKLLGGDEGEQTSDLQLGEHRHTSYMYKNFIGSFMILNFQDDTLVSKQQVGLE